MPSWASRITRHFWATRCGVVPERTNDSSCALAASSTERAAAVGNMTRLDHGRPILSIVMWDGTLGTSHESRLLRHAISLLHYFVASSSRPASSSREESCRRNSPRWSAPYPPKCPVLPGLRPLPLPASTPELARTPANGPSLASADRDRTHGPR